MKKFLVFFLILIALFYILSEFVVDRIIKGALENNLSNVLDRDIKIDTLKINYLSGDAETPRQYLMAGSVVVTLPILLIFVYFEKYLVSGLTAGSVKG